MKAMEKRLPLGLLFICLISFPVNGRAADFDVERSGISTGLKEPIAVYNDWSAYDELSDNIPLTEKLAMQLLDEVIRLKKDGVRIDYYVMDAFWFDPDGGYRTWRKPNWPNGPDEWIRKCQANGIRPGLWFSTNTLVKINASPEWQNSLSEKKGSMSFSEGGFLPKIQPVQDAHGITSDPMFADPGAASAGRDTVSGYRLRPNSMAIDSGRAIPNSGGRDFLGNRVPSCRGVDRGAMESASCPK